MGGGAARGRRVVLPPDPGRGHRRARLPGARDRGAARGRPQGVRLRRGGGPYPRGVRGGAPGRRRGLPPGPRGPSVPRRRGPARRRRAGRRRAAPDRRGAPGRPGPGRRAQHPAAAGALLPAADPAVRIPPGSAAAAERGRHRDPRRRRPHGAAVAQRALRVTGAAHGRRPSVSHVLTEGLPSSARRREG
ncbi:hypothetical protein SGPA1_30420 [Streptomyces misionensis JCM 4497]